MKPTLNVLSIDFNYFQTANYNLIHDCYPDTTDLPTQNTKAIWRARYEIPEIKKEIEKVTINQEQTQKIKEIIKKNYVSTEGIALSPNSMITHEHKSIYDFVKQFYDTSKYAGIAITHIDMNPDINNKNPTLDNENWIHHLLQKFPNTQITWIKKQVSDKLIERQTIKTPEEQQIIDTAKTDFKNIPKKKYELVFICRSDLWVPPHLNEHFIALAKIIIKNSNNCYCEKNIFKKR